MPLYLILTTLDTVFIYSGYVLCSTAPSSDTDQIGHFTRSQNMHALFKSTFIWYWPNLTLHSFTVHTCFVPMPLHLILTTLDTVHLQPVCSLFHCSFIWYCPHWTLLYDFDLFGSHVSQTGLLKPKCGRCHGSQRGLPNWPDESQKEPKIVENEHKNKEKNLLCKNMWIYNGIRGYKLMHKHEHENIQVFV